MNTDSPPPSKKYTITTHCYSILWVVRYFFQSSTSPSQKNLCILDISVLLHGGEGVKKRKGKEESKRPSMFIVICQSQEVNDVKSLSTRSSILSVSLLSVSSSYLLSSVFFPLATSSQLQPLCHQWPHHAKTDPKKYGYVSMVLIDECSIL